MSSFYPKNYDRWNNDCLIKTYCNSSFENQKFLLFVTKIISVNSKIFNFLKKFYKLTYLKTFITQKKFFTPFFLKIKTDIKQIISSVIKSNLTLKSLFAYLDYFHYAILNSETKIGKIRKFIIIFLKLKFKKLKGKRVDNNPLNKLKKYQKNFESSNLNVLLEYNIDQNFFKKRINRLFVIRKKLIKIKNLLVVYFKKVIKKIHTDQRNLIKFSYEKKTLRNNYHECNFEKKTFSIPISVSKNKNNYLIFEKKKSIFLKFKVLFEFKFFNYDKKKISIFYFKIKKKWIDFKYKNIRSELSICFFNFKKPNVLNPEHFVIKDQGKKNKKNGQICGKNFFYFRFLDVFKELSVLWKIKFKKPNFKLNSFFKTKKETIKKFKFFKSFIFNFIHFKILFVSLYQKIWFFYLKIDKELEKKKALTRKFQELKSMERDFQVFINFIQKLNNFEKKNILN